MMRFLTALIVATCVAMPAMAQDDPYVPFPDNEYVDSWFGTELIIFSIEGLAEDGWLSNVLPDELNWDHSYIAGLVNAQRSQSKSDLPLLDPNDYLVSVGYEEETDGGWESTIEFMGIRPSEVMLIFDALGGTAGMFGDAQLSYMPLLRREFYIYQEDAMATLELEIGDEVLTIKPGKSFDEIYAAALDVFEDIYGEGVMLNLYYSIGNYIDGGSFGDLSITAELPAG